ncbi:hypothetical protein KW801_02995 [Candidatus Saccharibacteria bacterium]|nr:hypothetical protein [Candidatus Saccharibacteria bacterium]
MAAALVLMLPSLLFLLPRQTDAATLTNTYVRLNRLKAAQTTSFRLQFRTVSAGATSLTLDFNGADATTWTGSSGSVNATQTTNTATCASETGDTALPGSLSASGSGAVVTISSITALSATTTYCVDLTSSSAVTNATAGEYHPVLTVGSDSTTVALRTIAEDQIVVTATVPPSFNFQFNNTTADAFGNLVTAGSSTSGKTITLTTNANSGWVVWAKSLNGGTKGSLKSVAAGNYFITSGSSLGSASHTLGSSVEDYGLAVTINTDASGGGTVALDAAYDGTSTKLGVLDSQNYRPVASANGTTTGDIINVLERASITGATPAANDYTDTITFIGAGNF